MISVDTSLEDLKGTYSRIKPEIVIRLEEFSALWEKGTEEDIYSELVFCLLTPQSKAKSCWVTLEAIRDQGLLTQGSPDDVLSVCNMVRFKYKKSDFVVESRKHFVDGREVSIRPLLKSLGVPMEMRDWLVRNVKGLGYKEASHFLRNVGQGCDLAILDRHILKNLVNFGVIPEIPSSIGPKKYKEVEEAMREFSIYSTIPMDHLDLLLWYKEAGEVFK